MKCLTLLFCSAVLSWLQASANTSGHCPPSLAQDKYNQVLDNRCYRFYLQSAMEYWDAEKYCRRFGGHLAMPKNSRINNFLTYHLRHTYHYPHMVWIGLNDYDSENHFEWADGSKLGSFFSMWADGDEGPRSGIDHPFRHSYEDCVMLDAGMSRGPWRDFRCQDLWIFEDHHEHFVCEFPVVPRPTPITRHTTTTQYQDTTTTHYQDSTTTHFQDTTTTHFQDTTTTTTTTTTPSTTSTTMSTTRPTSTSSGTTSDIPPQETTKPTDATPSEAPTSTTTTTTTAATTPQCPSLVCTKSCGMGGFLTDDNGCMICECDTS